MEKCGIAGFGDFHWNNTSCGQRLSGISMGCVPMVGTQISGISMGSVPMVGTQTLGLEAFLGTHGSLQLEG